MGVTGKLGGETARTLLTGGQPVRAIVRDARKGQESSALGCELAVAEMEDASALKDAFADATAVFILPPPVFDPEPGYQEAQAVSGNRGAALDRSTQSQEARADSPAIPADVDYLTARVPFSDRSFSGDGHG